MPDSGCESFVENSERSLSSTRPLRVITQYPNVDQNMQSPGRPTSLGVFIDNSQFLKSVSRNIFPQDSISQQWNVKSEDSSELDKFLGQFNNNGSTPVTPTSFLNPNNITEDQERFADNFSRTLNKVKAEQEGWASLDCSTSGPGSFAAHLLSRRALCTTDHEQQLHSSVLDQPKGGEQSSDEVSLSHFIVGSTSSSEASSIGLHGVPSVTTPDPSSVASAFLTRDPLVLLTAGTCKDTATATSCTISNRKLQNVSTSAGLQDSVALCMAEEINDDEGNITLTDLPESAFGQLIVSPPSASTVHSVDSRQPQWSASLPRLLSIATCSTTDSLPMMHSTYPGPAEHGHPGTNYTDLLFTGCQVVPAHSSVPTEAVGGHTSLSNGGGGSSSCCRANHVSGSSSSSAYVLSSTSTAAATSTATDNPTPSGDTGLTLLHYPSPAGVASTTSVPSSGPHNRRQRHFCVTDSDTTTSTSTTTSSIGTSAAGTHCSLYSDGGGIASAGKLSFEGNSFAGGGEQKQSVLATPITVLFARSPPVLSSHTDFLGTTVISSSSSSSSSNHHQHHHHNNNTSSGQNMVVSSQSVRCSSVASLTGDAPSNSSLNQQKQRQQHQCHRIYSDLLDPSLTSGVTALPTITLAPAANNTSGVMEHCTSTLLLQPHQGSPDVGGTGDLPVTYIPASSCSSAPQQLQNGILPSSSFQTLVSAGMMARNGFGDCRQHLLNPLISSNTSAVLPHGTSALLDDRLASALLPPLHPISQPHQQPCISTTPTGVQPLSGKRTKRMSGVVTASKQRVRSVAIPADPVYRLFDSQLPAAGGDSDLQSQRMPVGRTEQNRLEQSASDNNQSGESFSTATGDEAHQQQRQQLANTTPPSSLEDGSGEKDEWKLERKRARNRVAARRCRERKISLIRALENQVAERDAHVRSLEETLARYRVEGERLRSHIEHLANTYPSLRTELCKLHFLPRSDAQS